MRRSILSTTITAVLAATLTACAPRNTGMDQCSDSNVKLLEITDQKFTQLQQSGLSAATVNVIDQSVWSFMQSRPTPIAGCAIGITRADKLVFLKAYGDADTATERPFTVTTPSAIGSISKTLTALAALRLVHDHKLQLDTPAYSTLNAPAPMFGDPTLEQLLRHQAGYKSMPDFDATQFSTLASINAHYNPQGIEWPSLQPALVFPGYAQVASNRSMPDGNPHYSNTGYNIAGAMVDRRSRSRTLPTAQHGYENYIWHNVARATAGTEPTMVSACLNTSFRQNDIRNLARGYSTTGQPLDFSATGDGWGWEGPSGGWSMTIGDLARLMLILQSDAVIPKALIDSSMRGSSGSDGNLHMGLGLELSPPVPPGHQHNPALAWFGKGGDIRGFTADMRIWPNAAGGSIGVAFLCNQQKTGKAITGTIHDALVAGGSKSAAAPDHVPSPQQAPDWLETAVRFEPLVRRFASSYLADAASGERAWAAARSELLGMGGGRALVAALDGGDFEAAVRLLPALSWPDGSPVTP